MRTPANSLPSAEGDPADAAHPGDPARTTDHRPNIMVVYGTRPEAIKVAPVIRALRESVLGLRVVVTAQHREMLDQVNQFFEIVPDDDLNLMVPGQTLNEIFARVVTGMDDLYRQHRPDAVLVQGDTTTVAAAAIAGFNVEIPVIHLEAGLRSGDLHLPFPEEANRKLVTQIAALHLAPTDESRANLLHDGAREQDIVVTGNTVIDALQWAVANPAPIEDDATREVIARLSGSADRLVVLTTHRRDNLGAPMQQIGRALGRLAAAFPDVTFLWPAHRNPKVRAAVLPPLEGLDNVIVVEPLAYPDFSHLLAVADVVLTDSGGIQEEAPSLGKPVLVLRQNTERPEAVSAGTVRLIGTDEQRIVDEATELLTDPAAYQRMANAVNPYGDGRAAERSVAAIAALFGIGDRLADFGQ